MGEMSNKVFEEHKTLKENSKKVSQLKKQVNFHTFSII